MSQRYVCLGRPVGQRVAQCSRGFHASARKLEDQPGGSPLAISLKDAMTAPRQPRRERNAYAAAQIGNLQMRRAPVGGLARGIFPSGQAQGADPSAQPKVIAPRKPLIRRERAGPPGAMVRAPAALKVTRNAGPPGSRPQGPNLRARKGPPGASRGGPRRGGERGPKARERGASGGDGIQDDPEAMDGQALPDTLMQALYRMQRNQWDRKPYVPKYAPGSFEANELVHAGRELFKGEAPPVKVWGRLEKKLRIVGMHGAAATLKVRRVPDGDAMPFGQEHKNLLDLEKKVTPEQKPQEIAA
ncbi:hypothetical protein BU23DRAFT_597891 [Bimuria novae-zelandiae CBS 107.79]|uniref:Uncharacterized protein n=1 Tax=Bimuria novae-zelandiae CBS 107.79 TaxID=1447943 RepID=A0A6A5VE35_9PLEO|nr:hypothetical protein BU23DRAFT_597891 [Bimuria novae-zelandiae CBS 107.79]